MTTHASTLTPDQVCNLPADERETRLGEIRSELLPRARSSEALPDGRAWEFPREPELERKLEELVSFERVCCPGLGWELRPVPGDGLRLEVTGMDPGASVLSAVEPGTPPPARGWRRLAGAGAIGFASSFFVLCVLPMALVAAGGAALAGTAARLDDPRWIGGGTLLAGFLAWRVMKRRAARRSSEAEAGCGC